MIWTGTHDVGRQRSEGASWGREGARGESGRWSWRPLGSSPGRTAPAAGGVAGGRGPLIPAVAPKQKRDNVFFFFFDRIRGAGAGGLESVFLFASDVWKGNSAKNTPLESDPNFLNPGSREAPVYSRPRVPRGRPLSLPFPPLHPPARAEAPLCLPLRHVPVPPWVGHQPASPCLGLLMPSLSLGQELLRAETPQP